MDVSNYMDELKASGGRPVGRPKGPPKEKLAALHVRDVPASMKDALSALTEVGAIGFDAAGLSLRSTYGSQGEAVKTLVAYGMAYVAPYMVAEMERQKQAGEVYAAIIRCFLDDMALAFVTEEHFPKGSAAHAHLLEIWGDGEFQAGEGTRLAGGLSRDEAFREAAAIQARFDRLAQAHRAIGSAVVEHLGDRYRL